VPLDFNNLGQNDIHHELLYMVLDNTTAGSHEFQGLAAAVAVAAKLFRD
jgi:hypothetical protein